mgnify:CR=1 FL=1
MNIAYFRRPKILLLSLAALLAGGYLVHRALTPPAPPSYLTATASVADIQDVVLASGTVKAYKQVSVCAQVSGQIKSLKVALGERGPVWWDDGAPDLNRHMARTGPYAQWHASLPEGER